MLTGVEGVQNVKIDFGAKEAICEVEASVDPKTLAKAVSGRFSAEVKPN